MSQSVYSQYTLLTPCATYGESIVRILDEIITAPRSINKVTNGFSLPFHNEMEQVVEIFFMENKDGKNAGGF